MPAVKTDTADDKNAESFIEIDPTCRYGRYDELLGTGAVKKVYRAFDQEEGIEVAWNQVKLRGFCDDPPMLERLYSEVRLLKTLAKENIIFLQYVWRDDERNTLNFITEVCTSGDLRAYRKKHRHVSMEALKERSKQILMGLNYLHTHEPCVIHMDLKSSNVFVNGNVGQVKVGDLGGGGGSGEGQLGAFDAGDAGIHGAGAIRRGLHGARRHILVRNVRAGDGDNGDTVQ